MREAFLTTRTAQPRGEFSVTRHIQAKGQQIYQKAAEGTLVLKAAGLEGPEVCPAEGLFRQSPKGRTFLFLDRMPAFGGH